MPLKQQDFRQNNAKKNGDGDESHKMFFIWFLRFLFFIPVAILVGGAAYAFAHSAFMWAALECVLLFITVYVEATLEAITSNNSRN